MIDINQSVTQGDDVVINEGGDQHLGSYEEFLEKASEGLLTGAHVDSPVLPDGILDDAVENDSPDDSSDDAPVDDSSKPKRDSKGHFVKS